MRFLADAGTRGRYGRGVPASFREFPGSAYREWSAEWAHELGCFVRAYGELHPETFAGVYTRSLELRRSTAVALFTGDLERHRQALDARISVEQGARSVAELATIHEGVCQLVNDWAGARLLRHAAYERAGCVSIDVETDAFEDLKRALVDRFGDAVDVDRLEYREQERTFEAWTFDEDSLELTVQFVGGARDRAWRLEVVETDAQVKATVTMGQYVRTVSSRRPGIPRIRHALVGRPREATAPLTAPPGEREVIDTTTGVARPRDPARHECC